MIKLLFAGDIIPPETTECIYSDELREVLQDKDFSIVNLETPLTTSTNKIQKTGNNFKRTPETIKHIKDGYFDAATLSNNHIRDFGDEGVLHTIEACHQNSILTVGAGKDIAAAAQPLRINLKGKKISILNYSEREFNIADKNRAGANPFDLIEAFYQVKEEKQNSDFVFVAYHGGIEYMHVPTPKIVKSFKYLIDLGADAVIGHHTHFFSGKLIYKDKPIVFSLGNFFAETSQEKIKEDLNTGLIATLTINDNGDIGNELIPIIKNPYLKIVGLPEHFKRKELQLRIDEISELIQNDESLEKVWDDYFKKEKKKFVAMLTSSSRIKYALIKRLPFDYPINSRKARILLNLIRCDSHRFKSIEILEDLEKTKL